MLNTLSQIKVYFSKIFGSGATEKFILQMLNSAENEMYGLEMVEASNGKLQRGIIYTTLMQMEEKYLISSRKQVGTARRLYKITENGRAYLKKSLEQ